MMSNKKEEETSKVVDSKKNDQVQKELLKEVVVLIVGKHAENVINYMDGKKYINEFLIAKKLDITINQLRNILYKLSDEGIVSSTRKKDKRKGWYTYFWKIEISRSLEFLKDVLEKRINQLGHHIDSREKKNFYVCEVCGIEVSEENALLQNFTCNECGDVFIIKDNAKLLRELTRNIDRERKNIKIIEEEINSEREKLEKKRHRDIKKDLDDKKKILAKKKEERKKLLKKNPVKKKVVKKKVVKKKVVKKNPVKKNPVKKKVVKKKTLSKSKKKIVKKKTKSKK